MANHFSKNLVRRALPSSDPQHTFEMTSLKDTLKLNKHKKNVFVFDLILNKIDFAVSFIVDPTYSPWLLSFNKKKTNTSSLVFKVFPGFKIANYGYTSNEIKQIKKFFNSDIFQKGSFKTLLSDINNGLYYQDKVIDPESRKSLLSLQDNPEDIDKIYFASFHPNGSKNRSPFNAWKVQHILPLVWDQIESNKHISVNFTSTPQEGYKLDDGEAKLIKLKLQEQLNIQI